MMTAGWLEDYHQCAQCVLDPDDAAAIKKRIEFGLWHPLCSALADEWETEGCYVYGLYDLTVDLMYVGVTGDLRRRLSTHRNRQPWGHRIRYVSVEWRASRFESLRRESELIVTQKPLYNIAGVPV